MKNYFSKHKLVTLLVIAVITRIILLGGSLLINNNLVQNWVHWDGWWYVDIVKNGYDTNYPLVSPENIVCNQGSGACQRNFAFFPLYPVSINALHSVSGLSVELAGILLSNLAFLGCVFLLFKLAKQLFNSKVAFVAGLLFVLSPLSYIFSGLMTESIFTFLLLLTILLSVNKKYFLAGLVGGLLSATRNTGVLVLIPMIMIYWKQNKDNFNLRQLNWKVILGLLMVPTGIIIYALYLNYLVADPLAFIHIQAFWEKPVNGIHPLLAIPFSIFDYSLEGSLKIHIYDLIWFFGALTIFFVGLRKKLIPFYLNSIILWIFVPLMAGTMVALPRYISVLFPIYLIIGKLLDGKSRIIYICIISFICLLILSYFYILGLWITV